VVVQKFVQMLQKKCSTSFEALLGTEIVHVDMIVERPILTVFKASADREPIKPRTD
jgi:hypothetical protein